MTSSTDQEEALVPEPSLSCFKWSGPVVELAAQDGEGERGKQKESNQCLISLLIIKASAHFFLCVTCLNEDVYFCSGFV